MHSVRAKLYNESFYNWTQDQARALADRAFGSLSPNSPHFLHRFLTEKTVAIDTTAAGGNASLLTLGGEAG